MAAQGGALAWTGRILSGAVGAMMLLSGVMKFVGGPEFEEGIKHLGLPQEMIVPLAILEISCAVIYLIPATSVIGAILLTGYLGGAICTHWRVGDPVPFPFPIMHIALGVTVWAGLWLREPRLRGLIPVWRG
jgi:hypothetical protein